jgi:hypothetical protein
MMSEASFTSGRPTPRQITVPCDVKLASDVRSEKRKEF